jgi:hypothetical protein
MRKSTVFVMSLLIICAMLVSPANAQGPGFKNVFVKPDTDLSQGLQSKDSLDTTLGRQQGTMDKLIFAALTSSYGDVSGYNVSALSKIVGHKAADTYTVETLATLTGTTSKQAKVIQLTAEYDLAAAQYEPIAYQPNYIPKWPIPQSKPKAMSASAAEGVSAKKQAALKAWRAGDMAALGAPEVKVNPNAKGELGTKSIYTNALVSAPISSADPQAGVAADWIMWWFYTSGYGVHEYKYPYANAGDIGSYLSYDSILLAWYSNSHAVTDNYDGASATALVYNGPPWSPDSGQYFWYDYFWSVYPYDGLYLAVIYADSCNSMMWPLADSIIANSPRTYIGGMRIMPYYYSDNADYYFWYFALISRFNMGTSLWAAQYYNGLLGYYGAWGDMGLF